MDVRCEKEGGEGYPSPPVLGSSIGTSLSSLSQNSDASRDSVKLVPCKDDVAEDVVNSAMAGQGEARKRYSTNARTARRWPR